MARQAGRSGSAAGPGYSPTPAPSLIAVRVSAGRFAGHETRTDRIARNLDGHDSSYFLSTTGKAADADKLDGIDSAGFVQGAGKLYTLAVLVAHGTGYVPSPAVAPGFFNTSLDCQ
jgi:hypothetical protein